MSTSATQSGTTTRAGRSGKGLGIAAAALAIVIAGGFVFAINQGTDQVTVSATERAAQIASDRWDEMIAMNEAAYLQHSLQGVGNAEIERLNEMAQEVRVKTQPDFGIENIRYQLSQAGLLDSQAYVPSIVQPTTVVPVRNDGNLENVRSQLEQAGLLDSEPTELNQPEWDNRMP